MTPFSLRTRLTLWYTGALGATLVAFGIAVGDIQLRTFEDESDNQLFASAGMVEFALMNMLHDVGLDSTASRLLEQLELVDVEVAIGAVPPSSQPVLTFSGTSAVLRSVPLRPCHDQPITAERFGSTSYRLLRLCVPPEGGNPKDSLSIVVARSQEKLLALQAHLRLVLGLALTIGLGLTAMGGHWLSGKAISPIDRMARAIPQIGSENLDRRLPVRPSDGEIAQLSRVVNDLFDRLSATVGRERQFLTNAAHALRTPVAVLQAEVSETARQPDLTEDARKSLQEIEGLAQHLGRTVEYLLSLGRRDAGTERASGKRIYLDDVVSGTVSRLTKMAERRNIRVEWERLDETPVFADPRVVDQIAQILLENAFQYTETGGVVRIDISSMDGKGGTLTVEDNGPGLAEDDPKALFTPFVRGSAGQSSGFPGSGLGLAVARWLAESAGGRIDIEPKTGRGARFVANFPPAP